jgi:hypothetical protein
VNATHPALVLKRAAQRLPRAALWLFCACWVLPGVIGRDPWRNADVQAFGVMLAMAEGRTSWWAPTLGSVPIDVALLPHWLGAWFIMLGGGWLEPAIAARLAFALLLLATIWAVWWTTYRLAQTEPARPLPLAFGGEPDTVEYARALADGATLALIATLGLLQLGHETTPELMQLASSGMFMAAVASAGSGRIWPAVAAMIALPLLAASGAPAVSVAVGLVAAAACWLSGQVPMRRFAAWPAVAALAAAAWATLAGAWRWRVELGGAWADVELVARQWLWFMWPAWPLALWTLWRWRGHLWQPHVALPLALVVCAAGASVVMGGNDRALLLALPGVAVLAAFALPTLARSASAAIDWFSMCFFSAAALFIWFMYGAMQTGVPAKPAANVARLAQGFEPRFSAWAFGLALAATVAWMFLVRWRTGRHQHALWKSMVLPAGGVALCWVLLMTLWLQLLDYARSARPLVQRVAPMVGDSPCVVGMNFNMAMSASFEIFLSRPVDARPEAVKEARCPVLVRISRSPVSDVLPGWSPQGWVRRPTERNEVATVYRRAQAVAAQPAAPSPSQPAQGQVADQPAAAASASR